MAYAGPRIIQDDPEIRAGIRNLLSKYSSPEIVRASEATPFRHDARLWEQLVEDGWLEIGLPDQGQRELDLASLQLVLFELGRAAAPCPFVASAVRVAAFVAAVLPNSEAATKVLNSVQSGTVWTAVEPGAARLLTFESMTVTGSVPLLLDAVPQGRVLVPIASPTGIDWYGVAIEGDVQVVPLPNTGGTSQARVEFNRASAEFVGSAKGGSSLECWLALDRLAQASWTTGLLARVLELCVDHTATRFQFGRAIGSFQAVQHKLADMAIGVQMSCDLSRAAAVALSRNGLDDPSGQLAALEATEFARRLATQVVREAHQVFGGTGYSVDHHLHLYTRRLKSQWLLGEDLESLRELIASRGLAEVGAR